MLYTPLLVPLAADPLASPLGGFLLFVAATGALCLQHVASSLIRRRGKREDRIWLALYLFLLMIGGLPPLLRIRDLLPIALLGATVFGLRAFLLVCQPRRHMDRSLWGELIAVAALTLTGPAAFAVSRGRLEGTAWRLWAYLILYFGSGVFFVNMLLAAARWKGALDGAAKRRLGRGHLLYHAALIGIVGSLAGGMETSVTILFALAYTPALIRALIGWRRVSHRLPSLKRVGMGELLYTAWFAVLLTAWLGRVR